MVIVSFIIYLVGLIVFCLKSKHLLLILLSLEFIVLSLYLNIYIYILRLGNEFYFLMVFLSIRVCEGALGLSILVSLIRTHGNDYFKSMRVC